MVQFLLHLLLQHLHLHYRPKVHRQWVHHHYYLEEDLLVEYFLNLLLLNRQNHPLNHQVNRLVFLDHRQLHLHLQMKLMKKLMLILLLPDLVKLVLLHLLLL